MSKTDEIDKIKQKIADALGGISTSSIRPRYKLFDKSRQLQNCIWHIENVEISDIKNSLIFLRYNITFKKCKFTSEIDIKINRDKIRFIKDLYIDTCVFDKNITCKNICFKYVRVENSIFESNIDLRLHENSKKISCEKNVFKQDIYINSLRLEQEKDDKERRIVFIENTFDKKIKIEKLYLEDFFLLKTINPNNTILEIKNCNIKSFIIPKILKQCNISDTTFTNSINNKASQIGEIKFKKCIFEKEVDFENSTFITANFSKSTFKGIANFRNTKFGEEINSSRTIDFSEIAFEDNAYFDNCEFNYFTAFHTSVFKKTASFYKTKFNVMPNFGPGDFQGILNLNNATWFDKNDFDFDVIKDNIKNSYNKNDFLQNTINFRNSFCGIKHALSQRGNSIDAINYRKAELYCREMELNHEIEIDEKDRQKFNNNLKKTDNFGFFINLFLLSTIYIYLIGMNYLYRLIEMSLKINLSLISPVAIYAIAHFVKEISNSKLPDFTKWFECVSLILYRKTSDHHTNLNKIFHFTLLMIAVYGVNLLVTFKINNYISENHWYIFLNSLLLIIILLMAIKFFDKNIYDMSGLTIVFLIPIFTLASYAYVPHAAFGVLLYITILFLSYTLFISNNNFSIISVKIVTYFALFIILLKSPGLINPTLNIFDKENIENKNLLEKINRLDYEILSNLTRLSFRDCDLKSETKFDEGSIINQREIIIANKETLENMFDLLFAPKSIDNFTGNKDDFIKTKTIVENQDIYLKIYNAIKLDKINSQTYKSTYILYILVMILCLYSLTKTARKNSVMSN